MSQNCGNCCYYQEKEKGMGLCRRNPPSIIETKDPSHYVIVSGQYRGNWPLIGQNDWCGEWKEKKQEWPESG